MIAEWLRLRRWDVVWWVAANVLGFATLEIAVLAFLSYFGQGAALDRTTIVGVLMVLIFLGFCVALPQWFALQWRRAAGRSWLWSGVPAWGTAIGVVLWMAAQLFGLRSVPAGESLVGTLLVLLILAAIGLVAGLLQALMLRWPASRRWRWGAINALAMVVAGPLMLVFLGGLGYSAVTVWGLRRL